MTRHPAMPMAAWTAVLVLMGCCSAARAQLITPQWDSSGRFGSQVGVPPGQFTEVCEKLDKGGRVAWRFESAAPLDFNIHYHEGKVVRFAAQKNGVSVAKGQLHARTAQDYCWMWTNKGAEAATLELKLQRH